MGLPKETKEDTIDRTVRSDTIKIRNLEVQRQAAWGNTLVVCTTEGKNKKSRRV